MTEENKPEEVGISDEELMRMTMQFSEDDFNLEDDFMEPDNNPSKVNTHVSKILLCYVH